MIIKQATRLQLEDSLARSHDEASRLGAVLKAAEAEIGVSGIIVYDNIIIHIE